MKTDRGSKRILIITYAFWPLNIIGAVRPVQLASSLARKGYSPVVLTTIPWDRDIEDASRPVGMDDVAIRRTVFFLPAYIIRRARRIILPLWGAWMQKDSSSRVMAQALRFAAQIFDVLTLYADRVFDEPLWNLGIVFSGLRVVLTKRIDCIFCTVPPGSSLAFAAFLARIARIPLVTDFRDLWSLNEYRDPAQSNSLRSRLIRVAEKYALNVSSYVICNTETAKEIMDVQYPRRITKTLVIPNGATVERNGDYPNGRNNGGFTICHIGSLYADRDPADLLNALTQWKKKDDFPQGMVVRFIGRGKERMQQIVKEAGLDGIVEIHGHKNKQELRKMICDADLFLLFLGYRPSSGYVVPAKFYDYLFLEKPIVAFASGNSEVFRLMKRLGLPENVVTEPDPEKIIEILRREYARPNGTAEPFRVPPEMKRRYTYSSITDAIERVIEAAINKRK